MTDHKPNPAYAHNSGYLHSRKFVINQVPTTPDSKVNDGYRAQIHKRALDAFEERELAEDWWDE